MTNVSQNLDSILCLSRIVDCVDRSLLNDDLWNVVHLLSILSPLEIRGSICRFYARKR